jgi:hypothetical protein
MANRNIKMVAEYIVELNPRQTHRNVGGIFCRFGAAPVTRALENKDINMLKKLSEFTEREISELDNIGKSTIPKFADA